MKEKLSNSSIMAEIHRNPDLKERWIPLTRDQKYQVLALADGCDDRPCLLKAMRTVIGEINPDMKQLELRRTETGRAKGKFLYEIVDGDYVIAERRSDRNFVACTVIRKGDQLEAATFYGRRNLIQEVPKGVDPRNVYGLAKLA